MRGGGSGDVVTGAGYSGSGIGNHVVGAIIIWLLLGGRVITAA